MKDLLDRLTKAIGSMANPNPDDAPEEPVEMSMEDFMVYVTEQVEKAAADTPDIRSERFAHLKTQIEAVTKNFEGPTPGKASVQQFKDRGQQKTTVAPVKAPDNATPGSNFTGGPTVAPAGKPTTPSGGQLPPITAGGSGFSTPAAATFAKAMETLGKSIAELEKEGMAPAAGDPPAGDQLPVKTSEGDPPPAKPVTKAAEPMWPQDLNTAFGRGETDDDITPDWGFDNADAAARHAAEKPKPKAAE